MIYIFMVRVLLKGAAAVHPDVRDARVAVVWITLVEGFYWPPAA
jgi:hypothetical protein